MSFQSIFFLPWVLSLSQSICSSVHETLLRNLVSSGCCLRTAEPSLASRAFVVRRDPNLCSISAEISFQGTFSALRSRSTSSCSWVHRPLPTWTCLPFNPDIMVLSFSNSELFAHSGLSSSGIIEYEYLKISSYWLLSSSLVLAALNLSLKGCTMSRQRVPSLAALIIQRL